MSEPATGMGSTTASKKATATQEQQKMVEDQVFRSYYNFSNLPPNSQSAWLELRRDNHVEYLTNGLRQLNSSFAVLDANRPWICYWILHSIELLGKCVDPDLEHNAIDFLSRCQDKDGGYGGGPGQRQNLFLSEKNETEKWRIQDGGEVDVRACYTAISVASVLNILDNDLTENVGGYIVRYTFCGLATMILVNEANRLDLASLTGGAAVLLQKLHAIAAGGHCSSTSTESSEASDDLSKDEQFLEGTPCDISEAYHNNEEGQQNASDRGNSFNIGSKRGYKRLGPLFQSITLQQYLMLISQMDRGFRDKPGKGRDNYHTCYCLSGLSTSQYSWSEGPNSPPIPSAVLGPYSNLVEPVNPLCNIVAGRYNEAREFFSTTL